jgi:hypothetical protein
MGFSSARIQYYFMIASIIVLVPISLPLEGTDWAADMAPWNASDWVVLTALGTVVCIGAGILIQVQWSCELCKAAWRRFYSVPVLDCVCSCLLPPAGKEVLLSCCEPAGLQHATWKLSAPIVSLFYGLRLVFTVIQSKVILGTTIIQTPLQVGR